MKKSTNDIFGTASEKINKDNLSEANLKSFLTRDIGPILEYSDEDNTLKFTDKVGVIWEDQPFNYGSLEAFLVRRVFRAEGEKLRADSLARDANDAEIFEESSITPRKLVLCKGRVNKKIAKAYGADNAILYSRKYYWLNPKYLKSQR